MKGVMDRDRDTLGRRLAEEHDQRRIEQLEVQQRMENCEKVGKNDMSELFSRVKRWVALNHLNCCFRATY